MDSSLPPDLFSQFSPLECRPIQMVEVSVLAIAQWLAGASDSAQAAFFNTFEVELDKICSSPGSSRAMQLHYIKKFLSSETRYMFEELSKPY